MLYFRNKTAIPRLWFAPSPRRIDALLPASRGEGSPSPQTGDREAAGRFLPRALRPAPNDGAAAARWLGL